jgi:hypothetical protein
MERQEKFVRHARSLAYAVFFFEMFYLFLGQVCVIPAVWILRLLFNSLDRRFPQTIASDISCDQNDILSRIALL